MPLEVFFSFFGVLSMLGKALLKSGFEAKTKSDRTCPPTGLLRLLPNLMLSEEWKKLFLKVVVPWNFNTNLACSFTIKWQSGQQQTWLKRDTKSTGGFWKE